MGGNKYDLRIGAAVEVNENILVTGEFHDSVDFDPGPTVDEHESVAGNDIFLSKFDSDGNFIWARTWGGHNLEYPF